MTIPILPSADFDVTASFYGPLGFGEVGRWPAEYLILRHEPLGIELHFSADPSVDRWTNQATCYVRFPSGDEARACHASWRSAPIPEPAMLGTPTATSYGLVEFPLIDPHGNLVRLGGPT